MRRLTAITAVSLGLACAGAAWTIAPVARADDDPFGPKPPAGSPIRPTGPTPARPGAAPSSPRVPAVESPDRPVEVAAFRRWLTHEDWLCRALAAGELARRSDDGTVSLLTAAVGRETEPRTLAVVLRALSGRPREEILVEGGVDLGDRLIPLLRHDHPTIRARALAILGVLAPVRLGDRPDDYVAWWQRGRDGLGLESKLAAERRAANARAASPGGADVTHTVAAAAMAKYADLERIHRHGLELVVCLDATGSMTGVIDSAKRNVVSLLARLRLLAPRLRVGLVTYDDAARLRSALTTDAHALERELSRVFAAGGDDYEEGVDKALGVALRQDKVAWSGKALRVIVVVGDAPPHDEDVAPMLRAVAKSRADPLFDCPVRVDTISTNAGVAGDPEGLVPYFRALATVGHGAALKLAQTRELAVELVLSAFGPSWRAPITALLAEIDAFEAAGSRGRGG